MSALLFSLLYWLLFAPIAVVYFALGIALWLATLPFDRVGAWPHRLCGWWARTLIRLNPAWRIAVTGKENLGRGPYVLVANHQSQADILAMYFVPHHFKWISKASVFRIPLVGWYMYFARYISLVRGKPDSIARCMQEATRWLRRGVSVLFFPEGTRSLDGAVHPFKRGAFHIAAETGAEVLPITISGTNRVLPKGGWIFSERARMRIHIDPPVPPPRPSEDQVLADFLQRQIAARKVALDREELTPP